MNNLSFIEENYLKAIYKLVENGHSKITIAAMAEALDNTPATILDMFKRLVQKKLITYHKTTGAKLSKKGESIALQVVRKHRLWEVFLVEKLDFKWYEIHEIAEQLEHVQSDELIDRIDRLLNYPKVDPHGDPIPDKNGKVKRYKTITLLDLELNQRAIVVAVLDHSDSFLQYLTKIGVGINDRIVLKDIEQYDHSLLLIINNKKQIYVSNTVAKNILIQYIT